MDSSDDQQVRSVDVRLPPAVVTAFRAAGAASRLRSSALGQIMAEEFLRGGEPGHVPAQSTEDRRLTIRLKSTTYTQLASVADRRGTSVRGLLRLAIEQSLQRRGQL